MTKVSVIIPVYNTENYLRKCLDSVCNQTLSDIEVICINDCSTDNSLNILRDYAQKDSRIKIIDFKENKGVSIARNIGIKEAQGEYIGFIDSDDFIDLDFYEKLYNKALETNAEVVKGNVYDYLEETNEAILTDFYNINYKISYNKANFLYGFTSAIYKKTLIDKFNIKFPEKIHYFEDPYFSIISSIYCNKIVLVDSAKYNYIRHLNSLSSDCLNDKNILSFIEASKFILNEINNAIKIPNEAYKIYVSFLIEQTKNRINSPDIKEEQKILLANALSELANKTNYSKENLLLEFLKGNSKKVNAKPQNNAINQQLLDKYKSYDRLNKTETLVKIFVSYIKPSFLFKSEILTPIHLGRSVADEISKDGKISKEDFKWLYDNCISDDDFEGNISSVNRKVGFLTGTYWAYKNYEKLGNPKYFGSFGYRRLLNPDFLKNLEKYDLVAPTPFFCGNKSLKENIEKYHGKICFKLMRDTLKTVNPSDINLFDEYMKYPSGYFCELYIMKKDLFFKFCEWIFPMLFNLLSLDDDAFKLSEEEENEVLEYRSKSENETKEEFRLYSMRNIAFIIERLTGFFLFKIQQDKNYKVKIEEMIVTDEDYSQKYLEQKEITIKYKKHIDKLNLKNKTLTKSDELINLVSVVNNYKMYEKYYKNNDFINALENIKLIDIDNTKENEAITKRYNQFLNQYDYSKPCWFIFAHPDWEIQDDINILINNLDKNKIYGPAGNKLVIFKDKLIDSKCSGFIYEIKRDESKAKIFEVNNLEHDEDNKVDTLDCLAMFVHSSLIQKYNLRFDENLDWDLYVEDFCINASKSYNIEINTFEIENTHHSSAGFISLPISYYKSLKYLNEKYPDDIYGGTCSIIGGKEIQEATGQEKMLYKLRKSAKRGLNIK